MVTLSKSHGMVAAATAIAMFAGISAASVGTWAQDHPRRAEVNHWLANQNRRINQEFCEGEITRAQARNLHRQDRTVRGAFHHGVAAWRTCHSGRTTRLEPAGKRDQPRNRKVTCKTDPARCSAPGGAALKLQRK